LPNPAWTGQGPKTTLHILIARYSETLAIQEKYKKKQFTLPLNVVFCKYFVNLYKNKKRVSD
jgi:hypothetical protein